MCGFLLNNPEAPVFTSEDDIDYYDEVVLSKQEEEALYRRDLLTDDMSLFYRELCRLSMPSGSSDFEEEDLEEDCADYEEEGSSR
jgi:hypothetical protein